MSSDESSPSRSPGTFRKADRLVHIGHYRRVYSRGRKLQSPRFGFYVLRGRGRRSRLGVSVSKKYGNSPARNRIKRQVREAFRVARHRFPRRVDLVVVPRRAARGVATGEIVERMEEMVRRALEPKPGGRR